MTSKVDDLSNRILGLFGLTVSRIGPISPIRSLLDSLRPVSTGNRLVRVGTAGDGGYVLPDVLTDLGGVVSLGVGNDASFEEYFFHQGVPTISVDGSIESMPQGAEHLPFLNAWIRDHPQRVDEISLNQVLSRLPESHKDKVLKIDIEGAEWSVFQAMCDSTLRSFRIMAVEFHGFDRRMLMGNILPEYGDTLRRILQDFAPVYIHSNNCCRGLALGESWTGVFRGRLQIPDAVEVTFLRRDFVTPDSLDGVWDEAGLSVPNVPHKSELAIPDFWRSR